MADVHDPLIEALRAGTPGAFEQAYRDHRVAVFGFLVRLSQDRNVAADLFQNTWLKLVRHAARLRPDTRLRSWLFTVARNEYRSYRRWQFLDLSRFLVLAGSTPARGTLSEQRNESGSALEVGLGRLSAEDREVLLLVYVEGVEQAEAASMLGVSAPALRKRLSRARHRLESCLKALDKADESVHPGKEDLHHGPAL